MISSSTDRLYAYINKRSSNAHDDSNNNLRFGDLNLIHFFRFRFLALFAQDGKCEKRRKGVYGPQAGKQFILFVDDVNMPQKEEYGAQPPIEILRQWFDSDGWYDRKELSFRRLIDFIFVTACGPPGGKFLLHFF